MSDIELYERTPDQYEQLQSLRDDYRQAIQVSLELAVKFTPHESVDVVDFCGGTGIHLFSLAEKITIHRATLIDINPSFIDAAKKRQKDFPLDVICSDIIQARLTGTYDIILSLFAYHHVPDAEKGNYLQKAYDGLKEDGILVLTEIYLPDKQTAMSYYEMILSAIPEHKRSDQLAKFLHQTAQSEDVEFKVAKKFADDQIEKIGFKKVAEQKIWPLDTRLLSDVGTFVTVLVKQG